MRQFPILWSKVIYNGTHFGDFLTRDDVEGLAGEVQHIQAQEHPELSAEEANHFQRFLNELGELIRASRFVNKPIMF